MLKKHLLAIFLSAVVYNRAAAFKYLEETQMLIPLLQELINLKGKFKHSYERKLYIIGISELLQNE